MIANVYANRFLATRKKVSDSITKFNERGDCESHGLPKVSLDNGYKLPISSLVDLIVPLSWCLPREWRAA